jgi:hypothetical protein
LDVGVESGKLQSWKLTATDESQPLAVFERPDSRVAVALLRNFEFKVPLDWLLSVPGASTNETKALATKLRLRLSLWQNGLPADSLPIEGWMELPLLRQEDLMAPW